MPCHDDGSSVGCELPERPGEPISILWRYAAIGLVRQETARSPREDSRYLDSAKFTARECPWLTIEERHDSHPFRRQLRIEAIKLSVDHVELGPNGERVGQQIVIREIEQAEFGQGG